MNSRVNDMELADQGKLKIEWAEDHMPVLMSIRQEMSETQPFRGIRIAACLHVTKETGALVKTLQAGGAQVVLVASNPLSTQDDVAAGLVEEGISVFAWRNQTAEDYYTCIANAINSAPMITMDDGADLVSSLHKLKTNEQSKEMHYIRKIVGDNRNLIENVYGGTEETTTGVIRLRAMAEDGALRYPVIAVNDARSKSLFDNPIGTGQSTVDGIMRATNLLIAGKEVVVAGYGNVGEGIAWRARGLGAIVTIVEADPVKALKAAMMGFKVDNMTNAAQYGDVFITATGDIDVIRKEHFKKMKDGVVLCNSGHFNVEISQSELGELTKYKRVIRQNVVEHQLVTGRKLYMLAEGRLVNLSCAEGHPSEVMDLSFSIQALSAKYIAEKHGELPVDVLLVPRSIDDNVAERKLKTMGLNIEKLTSRQQKYISSWKMGTI
ncbi:MAG: adenosylhomocysteinase [Candidatus Ranarchaeia archaeon]